MNEVKPCPFEVGEIAVFESWFRFEVYISRVLDIHVEFYGAGWQPLIRKATPEQKARFYESGEYELVIGSLLKR